MLILPGCTFLYLLMSWVILQEHHLKNGYQLLYTPHVAKAEMWKTSGHLDFYAENMFDRIKVCLSSEFANHSVLAMLSRSWHLNVRC